MKEKTPVPAESLIPMQANKILLEILPPLLDKPMFQLCVSDIRLKNQFHFNGEQSVTH